MSKINLHLKYLEETGQPRPVEIDYLYLEKEEMEEMDPHEIVATKMDDIKEYVQWLEEAVGSVLDVNEKLLDQLRNRPSKITIKE